MTALHRRISQNQEKICFSKMGAAKIRELLFTIIRNYGGIGIFFSLLLEYVGLPIPGESLLLLSGSLSAGASASAGSVIWAAGGTFLGSMAAYAIGRRYGEAIVLKLGKPFHITKEGLDHAGRFIRKHEASCIILSRFLPGVRHITPYLSGIGRVNVYKNIFYNLAGAVLWCAVFIFLGNAAGSRWTLISKFVGTYTWAALALIVFLWVEAKFMNRYRIAVPVLGASTLAFILFTSELMENELNPFDAAVYGFLAKQITEDMTDLMKLISDLGSAYVLIGISAGLFAFLFIRHKSPFYGNMAVLNLGAVTLLNLLFKTVFHRARPDILRLVQASGYSFPSGHSMISAAFYGFLIYLCAVFLKPPWSRIVPAALALLILAIGVSRIYLGVHYASDVIGGFLAGFSWLVMFILFLRMYVRRKDRKRISA